MPGPSRGRPARRPLSVRRPVPAKRGKAANSRLRIAVGRVLLITALLAAGVKLVQVQGFQAEALSAQAERQRATPIDIPAERGSITDRNGNQLAFSIEARALYVLPALMRQKWDEEVKKNPELQSYEERAREIAEFVQKTLGREVSGQKTDADTVYALLTKDISYTEIADRVEPDKAEAISERYADVGFERRAVRVYPNGELASNIVGAANWRKDQQPPGTQGLLGLENSQNNLLSGTNGRRIVDTVQGNDTVVIPGPGRSREITPATPGKSLELTIDLDTQYAVQNMVTDYARKAGANSASAVVLDTATGEILAMANDKTFDPTDFGRATDAQRSNTAVSANFEPGSVHKIVTAAAAIEDGVYQPDSVLTVDGSIKVADRTIKDSTWHDTQKMSFTGVFAKSSNVGTLMAAQQVGADRFADLQAKFGLGSRTGSGLPGEEAGLVPPRQQWSGSTFGNLPIGQGLTVTLLQMTGMYQAIGNDGLRVPPRIIKAEIGADGSRTELAKPEGVRVVSPQTAKTVRDMFRSIVQSAPNGQSGTGTSAAVPGYQVSGKTGTGQQLEPSGLYSNSKYWITFAGIFPADSPRFAVGVMVDNPQAGTQESASSAPLFHDIASYLAQRYQVPMSAEPSPVVPLVL